MVLRGARPGGDLVPVLLDDEPDDPHASAPRDRRLAPVALALLAGLLVADVAVQAADAGRDGRRFTEAVSLSGSLVDPLEVAWREPARSVLGVADSLVLIGQRTGGEHVVGVDAATGEVRWRAPLRIDPGWCTFAAQTPEPVLVLVCARGVQSTLVTVLEPEDGGTVASRIWPGTLAVLRAVDGDLVLAGSDGAGRMVAERWSPHDDQVAWQFGSERGVVTPTETTWESGDDWLGVRSAGRVVIALADGARLADEPWPARPWPGAPRAAATPVVGGDATARGLAFRADGGSLVRLDGDGAELWAYRATSSGGIPPYPLLAVDGVLVCTLGSAVVALDLADGTLLWSQQTGLTQAGSAVTDGTWVAVAERDGSGTALVAREPADGAVRWRLPLADGPVARLSVTRDGTVLVGTVDEVVAYRARP